MLYKTSSNCKDLHQLQQIMMIDELCSIIKHLQSIINISCKLTINYRLLNSI